MPAISFQFWFCFSSSPSYLTRQRANVCFSNLSMSVTLVSYPIRFRLQCYLSEFKVRLLQCKFLKTWRIVSYFLLSMKSTILLLLEFANYSNLPELWEHYFSVLRFLYYLSLQTFSTATEYPQIYVIRPKTFLILNINESVNSGVSTPGCFIATNIPFCNLLFLTIWLTESYLRFSVVRLEASVAGQCNTVRELYP